MNRVWLTLVSCGLWVASVQSGVAQTVLLSDSFTRTVGTETPTDELLDESSWGDNDNAAGGSLTQTYWVSDIFSEMMMLSARHVDGSEGVLDFGEVRLDYDFATNAAIQAAGGMTIEFDFRSPPNGGHTGFSMGIVDAETEMRGDHVQLLMTSVDFGVIFRRANTSQLKIPSILAPNTPGVGGQGLAEAGAWAAAGTSTSGDLHSVKVEVETANFNAGTTANIRMWVDGATFDLTPAATGIAGTQATNVTWDNNGVFYLGFSSNQTNGGKIDNLKISAGIASSAFLGDFNADGTVDAADYTVYRDNLGESSAVLNGNGSGAATVVAADYDLWRVNFGNVAPPAAGQLGTQSVPEPTTLGSMVVALAAAAGAMRRRRRG